MSKALPCSTGQNNLIATLTPEDRALVVPHLSDAELPSGMVLERPGEAIDTVYFPVTGIGSMIAVGSHGQKIEAGLFGRDGMSGTALVMQAGSAAHETLVQVAGAGLCMPGERLAEAMESSPSLAAHLRRFAHTLMTQIAHTALSNGRARLEERLARWLLMCHDRTDGNTLQLTHEFLSVMLGVRRAGVTVGTHKLEANGVIRAERGRITILDRDGLIDEARQSYGVPEAEYVRLFG